MFESNYNVYAKINDGLLIYNSLTNSLVHLKNKNMLEDCINDKISPSNNGALQKLKNLGIIVSHNKEKLLANKKLGEFIFQNQLHLTILPTMQCNFRCRYCYETFKQSDIKEEQIQAIEQYLVKNLKNYTSLNIEWFGGEPLLNIKAIEIISEKAINLCRFYHIPYFSEITTNGYLLTIDTMKRLLKSKIYFYQITLDGSEEEHNLNRPLANGGETFKNIVSNLINIKNQIKSTSFKITIRYNVTQKSLGKLSDHLDYLRKNFGDDNRFEFTFYPVENWGGEGVETMQSSLLENKNTILDTIRMYPHPLNIRQQFRQFQNYSICPSLSLNHFVIVPSGDIYKCTLAFDNPMNHIGQLDGNGTLIIDQDKLSSWSLHTADIEASCSESCKLYANCFAKKCPLKNLSDSTKCRNNILKAAENLELAYRFNHKAFVEID